MAHQSFYDSEPDYVHIPDNTHLGHIPGDYGLPVLGHTIRYLKEPFSLIEEKHRAYGDVFKIGLTFQKYVMCVGPDYMKQLTLDPDKVFSTRMGYHAPLKHFFEGGLLMRDFAEHKFHRRIMQTAFKTDALRGYVDAINPLVDRALDDWGRQEDFLFYPRIKALLLEIGAKVFLGLDLGSDETQSLNQAFLAMGEGTLAIIRKDWPGLGLAYRRGMNGRRYLDRYFLDLVPQRRGQSGRDMATYFCNETTEEGELYPDDIVSKHLIFLLLAAHDTTTAALTMACYYLAHEQDWQERLRDEARGLAGTAISYEELAAVPTIDHTFKEVERLHPSVPAFSRRTIAETELGGYRIPAHTPIQIPVIYTQRMDRWWRDPHRFDPDRFAREEHKQHPFMWAPFGGGAHKCIGLHFADMLFKCVMSGLLRRYRLAFPAGYAYPATIQHFPFPKPRDDLPLMLHRL
jgi:cytochrome P450